MSEVKVIISLTDKDEGLDIEMHSSDMANQESPANAIAEFLAASWDNVIAGARMYSEAIRQARVLKEQEDATGVVAEEHVPPLVAAQTPRLLSADGNGYLAPSGG